MVGLACAVVAAGAVSGALAALGGGGDDTARPTATASAATVTLPAVPPSVSATPSRPRETPRPAEPSLAPKPSATPSPSRAAVSAALYRSPDSQVLDWVRDHPDDPRRSLIERRIADQPTAVWFTEYDPGAITREVRAVTSAAAGQGRVPVLVPYAIPGRDCGGASQGGAPSPEAYDTWIGNFAAGLGRSPVIVVLEPDAIAQSDCLSEGERAARFASLARAGRAIHSADARARVYFDAGHSGWRDAGEMAGLLRAAGAATSGDGIFTNVSNFHRTSDEVAYARRVLKALGGPARLGAVIDTSRNGKGAPPGGEWCDPAGRALGRTPTTHTGEARIDAYLWVKVPGESDGCRGTAGSFTPDYAYDLAR
ncbi:glycoside hydrolase family 6 protein [Streptomyces sp. NPDC059991]|uniref:glycoside hydrolase family 6 protein n=1 Tax=Streptomyces sp. NPDC059991 TaxID=3347028 RepID=UPI0036C56E85